jgi:folate-dependent phosphoribosylglycinamide formyltransferase PurN
MKIVFAGTPAVAVPTLEALVASGHEVVAVITRADAPVGRKRVLTPSPVAAAAERAGLTVIKANRLDDDVTAAIRSVEPDLGVIVAYGGLVKRALLDTPTHGWINLHFSLLPRWRGAAPVQHSLIAGDEETGVSIFQLVPELDAGDIFLRRALPAPATYSRPTPPRAFPSFWRSSTASPRAPPRPNHRAATSHSPPSSRPPTGASTGRRMPRASSPSIAASRPSPERTPRSQSPRSVVRPPPLSPRSLVSHMSLTSLTWLSRVPRL